MAGAGWFNPFIDLVGGRTGWLGRFYQPSLAERADEKHAALEVRRAYLDIAQENSSDEIAKLKKKIVRQWKKGLQDEARQSVKDLRRERVEYARIGRQRNIAAAVSSKLQQLRTGTATEDALEFYVTGMGERASTMSPAHQSHVLGRVAMLHDMQTTSDEMLTEFFADDEQEDALADEETAQKEEELVNEVLVELGCLQDMRAAPSLRVVDAAADHPPNDNRGGGAAAPPAAAAAEHDADAPVVPAVVSQDVLDVVDADARLANIPSVPLDEVRGYVAVPLRRNSRDAV